MTPQWGFVIAACTALVLLLAFGGIGVSMQLERARGLHPDEAVDGVRAVLRILIVFALVTPFWSLFDQKASTWIVQANSMDSPTVVDLRLRIHAAAGADAGPESAAGDAADPLQQPGAVPAAAHDRLTPTPLRRMGRHRAVGHGLDRDRPIQLRWTAATGLDPVADAAVCAADAGRGAGLGHRPRIRLQPGAGVDEGHHHGFWYLAVTVGSLWVLIVNASVKNDAVLRPHRLQRYGRDRLPDVLLRRLRLAGRRRLRLYAVRYKMVDNYRSEAQ
jgi:POT family proton-dependent oligopeptide transporter